MSSLRGSARRRLLILLALTTAPVTLGAGVPPLGADGWHSWRVEAVAAAPDWCCLPGPGSADDGGRCSLDAGTRSYGSARARGPAPGRSPGALRLRRPVPPLAGRVAQVGRERARRVR